MATSSNIHARIDGPTKEATESVLRSLGMTPTEAIRLLYRQIALRGEFPIELRVPNELTAATLSAAERGEEIEEHIQVPS
jgi:DNA-damage-inducible protein J